MNLKEVRDILHAEVLCGGDMLDTEVRSACGSDFMSDVLAYVKNQALLLTGLVNPQVVRTGASSPRRISWSWPRTGSWWSWPPRSGCTTPAACSTSTA